MGFIGKVFKGIGKAIGGIAKGVLKFAKSPFGQILMQIGLNFIAPGVGGLIGKGLSMLGTAGKLGGAIGGIASNFLGSATSMLSGGGNGILSNILGAVTGSGGGTGGILDTVQQVVGNWSQPKNEAQATTQQAAMSNVQQQAAYQQSLEMQRRYQQEYNSYWNQRGYQTQNA